MPEVSPVEEADLKKGICPDCGGDEFLEGPRGGLAVNIRCKQCGAEFNIRWPFTPERLCLKKS